MEEIRRQSAAAGSPKNEAAGAKRRLRELEAQRGRLLRLFQLGEIDEPHLRRETVLIRAEQERLAEQATRVMSTVPALPDAKGLRAMCDAIREWVDSAEGDDLNLLLDALQIRVDASRDGKRTPWRDSIFRTDGCSCRCLFNGSEIGLISIWEDRHDACDLDALVRGSDLRIDSSKHEIEVVPARVLNPIADGRERRWHVACDPREVAWRGHRLSLQLSARVLQHLTPLSQHPRFFAQQVPGKRLGPYTAGPIFPERTPPRLRLGALSQARPSCGCLPARRFASLRSRSGEASRSVKAVFTAPSRRSMRMYFEPHEVSPGPLEPFGQR